jgi:2-polyprenyl-6-hydroxyphenyl methylase/3-demethylubiquinone-9 3-methyltransferase
VRGFLLSYGPSNLKRRVWDKEYSENKWHFADHTVGDCVYPHLERHAAKGSILDIGCGSGNTGTELADTAYTSYLGVDISEEALDKARKRSEECGRQEKNSFECGDFLSYVPTGRFDVILFRESLYHVPMGKIKGMLDRYATHLKEGGVMIVRMFTADRTTSESKNRPLAMIATVEENFEVLDKTVDKDKGRSTVIVFRPKMPATLR